METGTSTRPLHLAEMSMVDIPREHIIGARLLEVGHSPFSSPEFIVEGIGPATFRAHYLRLDSGIVLELSVAEVTVTEVGQFQCQGETVGLPLAAFLGELITAIWSDDILTPLLVFENGKYLRDANDGFYGNPLYAGIIQNDYSTADQAQFKDYWTELPAQAHLNLPGMH